MTSKMNVLVTFDDRYYYPCIIMLHTLFERHPDTAIRVFLIHSRVSESNLRSLAALCEEQKGAFVEVPVSEKMFSDVPTGSFPREMYYRVLAARILPPDLDRILYLDPDMIVTDSLLDFYQMPLEGIYFAGAQDRWLNYPHNLAYRERVGFHDRQKYINSGVLLIHLELLRKEQDVAALYQKAASEGANWRFPDQDLINTLYEDQIAVVDDRYNLNANILWAKEWLVYSLAPFLPNVRPAVIHFPGLRKPWRGRYAGNLYGQYWSREWKYSPHRSLRLFLRVFKIPVLIIWGGLRFPIYHFVKTRPEA